MQIQTRRPMSGVLEVKISDGSTTIDFGWLEGNDLRSLAKEIYSVLEDITYCLGEDVEDYVDTSLMRKTIHKAFLAGVKEACGHEEYLEDFDEHDAVRAFDKMEG